MSEVGRSPYPGIVAWLDQHSRWDHLRQRMSNRLIQSTIVIPIVGYIILFSSSLEEYFCLRFVECENGVSYWRMYWLYFGFCSLAAAAMIFNLKCPSLVAHHGAAYEFVDREFRIMGHERLVKMDQQLAKLRGRHPQTPGNLKVTTAKEELMRDYFVMLKSQSRNWRIAVYLLYWLGALVVAVPTVVTFVAICRHLLWS